MTLITLRKWISSPKLSIQAKIFIAFGLLSLFSIVSVTGIVYVNMRETIKANAITSVSDSIRQADESLNVMLKEIDRLNTVAATNKNTVIDTVLSPSEEISYEWFQEQKRITEFLSGLIDYKPYISRIAVIGLNGKVFFAGGPWIDRTFLETKTMDYMLQNGERHAYFKQGGPTDAISVGRVLRYNRETIGVVMVDLNYDFIRNTYGVKPTADSILYVLDEQNELVYRSDSAPLSLSPQMEKTIYARPASAGPSELAAEQNIDGKSYIVVTRRSDFTGWTTRALIPLDSLLSESVRVRNLMVEVSVVVFIAVLIGTLQMSSRTTLHIRRLKTMMTRVKDGNLDFPKTEIGTKDEIGELYRVFISMVDELKRLMEGIRVSEQAKREAELTALQAQIRPHFLYNALNTIKYLAKLNGAPNIEEVSGALIELMRGVLGNSNEFLTVREELDYVSCYVSIVKYRFMNPIPVHMQIEDDALLECRVLKLMLQPIVENALMHGLGAAASGGFVLIRVYGEEGDLKIEVMDNGRGMTREQIDALLGKKGEIPSRFSGMGVRNVHERIARMYGEPYGVKLYSEEGLYTKVEIRFPRIWSSETRAEEVG
ncbi:MAG: sensor histidine kinase [Paenibacillus macerans]|uniref:HAMP domain protein n=1 Tax=Paenibacillus macerans TaxID=44252 RepID=A0A090YAI2_PAEMA|nr:sensor histidine kinase [Paenibacillus macerans]KFM95788.1 HAMP domain protein [Paenibacillus macerans]MBS5912795.1 sensor histidine kinase [Paenibacillus macerans]MCY7562219.1 sensor histidine kinase [Paenibacillus macerans]MDU7475115.1 sensor histidine kinase [Paenibacillus macerans]MEC0139168.1 sensor histidine kinase [Paenibacillus macerans]